ncbi:imelysin family protein [Winogradskyella pulchriflava]|uniref:Imelysin family protein n=1 Tax=Winogradskyella pulchriflava TaxID=1110688 RepID=A0ABV6QCF0_9FLAO
MLKRVGLICLIALLAIACNSSDENNSSGDNFDRGALLTHTADNIIIPIFEDLQAKLEALETARETFSANTTENNLESLSDAWLEAYKVWQHVQMFNIGQAKLTSLDSERGFRTYFNRYPITKTDIEGFAANGNYDLEAIPTYNSQGFPGLDFLIHGVADTDANPIDKFTINSNATGYLGYLEDLVNHMLTTNATILNDWQNNYRDTFVNNTDSGLNGSFNMMANDLVFFYEKGFRAEKIGIPIGVFSNEPLPEKVEAFYKKTVSKTLALEALTAIENTFNGKAYDGTTEGPSLKTYLEFLDRSDLVTEINNQFETSRNAINGLNDNFYQQIIDNNNQMTIVYDVIQAAVPKLKVDMKQALNFIIDYTDSDGD